MADRFNPPQMWGPKGRAFSQGVIPHQGQTIYITGQVAWDMNHQIVGIGDVHAQLHKTIENIEIILNSVGGVLQDIVSLTIYFTDQAQLPDIQAVRSEYFSASTAPTSTLIQVVGLVDPDLLVEIVPIAVIPYERFRHPQE